MQYICMYITDLAQLFPWWLPQAYMQQRQREIGKEMNDIHSTGALACRT